MNKRWLLKSVSVALLVAVAATLVVNTALAAPEDQRGPRGPHGPGRGLVLEIAEATGQPVEDVLDQLEDGQTPAEILSDNGVDPDDFVADMLSDLEDRLDQAVDNDRIDQARADEILANAETRLTEAMNQTFDPPDPGEGAGNRPHRGVLNFMGRILDATGLTREEFVEAVQSGQTPAEILSDNGVDTDDFIADALADLQARLDEAVANGLMDQARADEILETASEKLPEVLNGTFEGRPSRGFGGGLGNGPDGPPGQGPGGQSGQGVSL